MKQDGIKNLIRNLYKQILRIFAGSGLRKIKFIEDINIFLRVKLKPNFVITKKYNHKMFLDKIDSLYLSVHKDWDDFETTLLEKEIQKGNVVLDLGANIGFYTLVLARLVGEKGKVYAFEADPTNFEILKKNVEINGYKNVILINKAVLDKNGKIKFYVDEGNTAGNSIYQGKNTKSLEVEAVRLDNYFTKDRKIDFVKIDIEGSEFRAMMGMSKLLKENKKIKIMTEFYPKLLNGIGKENGLFAIDYLKFLRNLGFELYDIQEDSKSLVLSSDEEILNKCGNQWTNLFCKRKDIRK